MREEILGRKPKAAREITRRRYVNERADVKGTGSNPIHILTAYSMLNIHRNVFTFSTSVMRRVTKTNRRARDEEMEKLKKMQKPRRKMDALAKKVGPSGNNPDISRLQPEEQFVMVAYYVDYGAGAIVFVDWSIHHQDRRL
jgi:hypothetical protein